MTCSDKTITIKDLLGNSWKINQMNWYLICCVLWNQLSRQHRAPQHWGTKQQQAYYNSLSIQALWTEVTSWGFHSSKDLHWSMHLFLRQSDAESNYVQNGLRQRVSSAQNLENLPQAVSQHLWASQCFSVPCFVSPPQVCVCVAHVSAEVWLGDGSPPHLQLIPRGDHGQFVFFTTVDSLLAGETLRAYHSLYASPHHPQTHRDRTIKPLNFENCVGVSGFSCCGTKETSNVTSSIIINTIIWHQTPRSKVIDSIPGHL